MCEVDSIILNVMFTIVSLDLDCSHTSTMKWLFNTLKLNSPYLGSLDQRTFYVFCVCGHLA